MSVTLLLYLLALICEVLAALNINPPRVNLGWLGLALFFTALVLEAA